MTEVNVVPSIMKFIRNVVPLAAGISDAEIGLIFNIALLAAAIIAHLISKAIHNRKNANWLDHQSFFELGTENKRLRVDLSTKDKEIKRLSGEIYELEARVDAVEKDARECKEKMKDTEEQLKKEEESKCLLDEENKRLAADLSKMSEEVGELEYQLQTKKDELNEVQSYYEDSKVEVQKLFDVLNEDKENRVKLLTELEQVKGSLKEAIDEKEELNLQLSGMTLLLENTDKTKQNESRSDHSGAINPSTVNFGEIARMRSELNTLEKDNEKLGTLLDLATAEKGKLEELTNALKLELERKDTEIDKCSTDRRGADDRANQLLSLLHQCNSKIEEKDLMLNDLRNEMDKLRETIEALREEIRSKDDKLKESDAEVKRWRNDYLKLETTSYAKEKEYHRQIHSLQTLATVAPTDAFNFNNTLISDQENHRPPRSEQNGSLWDQPDMDISIHRSMLSDENAVFRPEQTIKARSGKGRRSEQGWLNGMESAQNTERRSQFILQATNPYKIDTAHRDIIHDAQLNYYGNRLATCSSDRTVKVFEVRPNGATFPFAELTGHTGPVWQISWAHPRFGNTLATASYDKKIIIWQEQNGKFIRQYEWTGHEASVNSVAFAPYQLGLIVATGSSDGSIGILSYSEATQQWTSNKIVKAHEQGVNAVSWAPAIHTETVGNADQPLPRRLVSCGNDKIVNIWLETDGEWKLERQLSGHTDFVRDVAWCPVLNHTTQMIASCGIDRRLILWISQDGGEFRHEVLQKAEGTLWHVSWSPCGTMLSVSGEDNKISLWKQGLQNIWTELKDDA